MSNLFELFQMNQFNFHVLLQVFCREGHRQRQHAVAVARSVESPQFQTCYGKTWIEITALEVKDVLLILRTTVQVS